MADYKKLFPLLIKNPDLHYLDSGATTLKPQVVLDKIMEYYTEYSANIHRGLYPMSERATMEYENVRKKVATFINTKHESEVVFTSGTTASLNLVSRGWGEDNILEGDEVVISEMEHHSNLVPWQELCKRKGAILRYWLVEDFQLVMADMETYIGPKTKLIALTQVSNVLGTVNPIEEIVERARKINPKICIVIDGAQAVGHFKVDIQELNVDFYAFSAHKMYGPTGVGVLYAKASRQLQMSPENFGGGMIKEVHKEGASWAIGPEKFEAGTPPIAQVIGLGAAVDFLSGIGMETVASHEKELIDYAIGKLEKYSNIRVLGKKNNRIGVFSVVFNDEDMGTAHDWSSILGSKFNVCVRAGHHCAMPLHNLMGLPSGTLRASLGIYSTKEDIDAFVEGLIEVRKIFEETDNG
ncbi:cysteine desulfurase [Candidatus Shapirobacteria bacterium]|nr:cysteine desulfurase [Candidatus Shapirobacteria bacterium]